MNTIANSKMKTKNNFEDILENIPVLNIIDRFGYYVRVWDFEIPKNIVEIFQEFKNLGFLKNIPKEIKIKYPARDNNLENIQIFNQSIENCHQVMTLSTFLASIYSNSKAIIKSPHIDGSLFIAKYSRISDKVIQYETDSGEIVTFIFP